MNEFVGESVSWKGQDCLLFKYTSKYLSLYLCHPGTSWAEPAPAAHLLMSSAGI